MDVLITNLQENTTCVCKQFPCYDETITQIA